MKKPNFGAGVSVRVAFNGPYRIFVIGEPREPLADLYHRFLRMPWLGAISVLFGIYLLTNLLFATAFFHVGGVANARPGSFVDVFFFSVDTMGTIGYGAMYPSSPYAHALVTMESFTGLLFTALATGLFFAKVAQPGGRLVFSKHAVVTSFDGKPTLMFRLGNGRTNQIIEATVRVDLVRAMRNENGVFYRQTELQLVKTRSAALARSWTVMHVLDEASPLYQATPESMALAENELIISVVGIDDTSTQTVHGRHNYTHTDILFDARYKDILSETPDGDLVLDVRDFDAVEREPAAAKTPLSA